MKAPEVYILTGPVRSGKTTALLEWSEKRKDIYGILTPVVMGKRVFMDAQGREQFAMEATEGETGVLKVGRFQFSKAGFDKAVQVIRNSMQKEGWLVIDEIGPLECSGEGFHDILKELLPQRTGKLLLVIRDNNETMGKAIACFNLTNSILISSPAGL